MLQHQLMELKGFSMVPVPNCGQAILQICVCALSTTINVCTHAACVSLVLQQVIDLLVLDSKK